MTPDDVITDLLARFPDTVEKSSWGERAVFLNPGGVLPSGVYFATIKLRDGENDRASDLDHDGAWRLNIGVPPALFENQFGPRPARPAKGGIVATGHDFTARDILMPHPVYAWMGWVAIVCPSKDTYDGLTTHLEAAYDKARKAVRKRLPKDD